MQLCACGHSLNSQNQQLRLRLQKNTCEKIRFNFIIQVCVCELRAPWKIVNTQFKSHWNYSAKLCETLITRIFISRAKCKLSRCRRCIRIVEYAVTDRCNGARCSRKWENERKRECTSYWRLWSNPPNGWIFFGNKFMQFWHSVRIRWFSDSPGVVRAVPAIETQRRTLNYSETMPGVCWVGMRIRNKNLRCGCRAPTLCHSGQIFGGAQ